MNYIRKLMKHEKGGYQLTEAAILYPFTFLMIMFVIYIGLYIIQVMTVSSYAQKVALLSARELSCPGYRDIVNAARLSTSAAELDFKLSDAEDGSYKGKVNIDNKVSSVKLRAYRYWSLHPLNNTETTYYQGILKNLVKNNSLLSGAKGKDVKAVITSDNYVVAQYITVEVKQELMHFAVLDLLGIQQPNVEVRAKASVNDTDELVRTTDFVCDAVEALANRLGIDTSKVKKTVSDCLTKLGITY